MYVTRRASVHFVNTMGILKLLGLFCWALQRMREDLPKLKLKKLMMKGTDSWWLSKILYFIY
jgi:hypothetical protein